MNRRIEKPATLVIRYQGVLAFLFPKTTYGARLF